MSTDQDTAAGDPFGIWAEAIARLVSYRHLGCRSVLGPDHTATGSMRLRDDLRCGGAPLLAPVAIAMLDTAGIAIDRHWQAAVTRVHVELGGGAKQVRRLGVAGALTRKARSQVFTEALFSDAESPGSTVGFGSADWAVVSDTPPGFQYQDPGDGPSDDATIPSLTEVFGARPDGDGYTIAELTPELGGALLHHGPILVSLEAAALRAAGEPVSPPLS